MGKYKVDGKKYLKHFIDDLELNECLIKAFVGDNPKRANARCALQHSSLFACEYCYAKAVSYNMCEAEVQTKKRELENQKHCIEQRIEKIQNDEEHDAEEIETLVKIRDNLIQSIKEVSKKKN